MNTPLNDSDSNYILFLDFLKERELIRCRRESGQQYPWTNDIILRDYKFTNVSRKHDRFTLELEKLVKAQVKTKSKEEVVFNILVHRNHSRTETIKRWGWVSGYKDAKAKLLKDKKEGNTSMTGAFIRSLSADTFLEGWEYYAENSSKLLVAAHSAKTLKDFFRELRKFPLVGNFIGWQMLCDFRLLGIIPAKPDDDTFVVLGPGAKRGVSLMPQWLSKPINLLEAVRRDRVELNWLCIEDIEHSLCEFSKYHRALTNNGRPKQRYMPNSIPLFS